MQRNPVEVPGGEQLCTRGGLWDVANGGGTSSPLHAEPTSQPPGGLRAQAAQPRLTESKAPGAFPFATEPTNLMKPSQCRPRGLLEKDSSTTLFHSSRLHHFHFTAFQWEIIKQNYKHNEERKEGKKPLGERRILCAMTGLVTLFLSAGKYYLAPLCRKERDASTCSRR